MRALKLALLAAACLFANACQHVDPWDRNVLARPDMAWESDDLAAAHTNHTYFSKEAAMPGGGAGGGGCGCN
jgi:hypothetical protein